MPNRSETSLRRQMATQQLRRAATDLGVTVEHLRVAGLPASARAAERLRDRTIRLRHKIEDGEAT